MTRKRIAGKVSVAVVAVAGLAAGLAVAACGSSASPAAGSATPAAVAGTPGGAAYSYYRSMMGRYSGGSMMGGAGVPGWMRGAAGYRWMMGGVSAPGWMRGGHLPGAMMGTSTDPGKLMGRLWANAPGPRVSPTQASRLGSQIPAGARINRANRTIAFSGSTVHLAVLASPSGGPDETFRAAGMVNPAITVKAGSRVSIQVINADPDTAHGLVITASQARSSWMPMMSARPAFGGSALWFLGNPTASGMHAGTLTFTATTPGTYTYLCPVPGHSQKGMAGSFTVTGTG
ncbi:MAG TPA: sulfocyanin-like copper-binding protein [Streptosporangiaceae bacterium]